MKQFEQAQSADSAQTCVYHQRNTQPLGGKNCSLGANFRPNAGRTSFLAFYRWHATNSSGCTLPIVEADAWSYVQHLKESGAAPTTATSFVQSLRFCHHTLGLSGALTAADTRRIGGSAELQLALKPPARQTRPLTVTEVRRLHSVACSAD